METNELHNIWKNIDSEIHAKSTDELNLILIAKTKKTINKYLYVIGFSILVCAGLIVFLTVTSMNRKTDVLYQINNTTLCLVALFALVSSLHEWYKMQNNRYNQPLKSWLEERINSLSEELTGRYSKLYLFYTPILYMLTVLSIHVYFENKLLIEVLKTEESIVGLIVGAPLGLFVSYFGAKRVRKYHLKNLEHLKELHGHF